MFPRPNSQDHPLHTKIHFIITHIINKGKCFLPCKAAEPDALFGAVKAKNKKLPAALLKKAKRRALNYRNKLKTASAGLKAGGKPIPRVPKFKASRRKGTHNIGQHEKGGEKYKCDKGGAAKAPPDAEARAFF